MTNGPMGRPGAACLLLGVFLALALPLAAQTPDLEVCDDPIQHVPGDPSGPGILFSEFEIEVDEDITIDDIQIYLNWERRAERSGTSCVWMSVPACCIS